MPGSQSAAAAANAEPDFVAMEVQALTSLVADLATAVAAIAPGALDRTLQIARLRLQDLETGQGLEALANETTILRFKVSMLEIALGRHDVGQPSSVEAFPVSPRGAG